MIPTFRLIWAPPAQRRWVLLRPLEVLPVMLVTCPHLAVL